MRPAATVVATAALALGAHLFHPPPAAGDDAGPGALLERYAPAVVSVEAVVKIEFQMGGQGNDQETTLDTVGAVVDPSGLIMMSNLQLSATRIRDIMSAMGAGGGFELNLTPQSFEVRLPGETKGRKALLAAVDQQLDLAFLQLEEPPAEPLVSFDLGAGADPVVGETVYSVSRLNESFDHAAYFESYRVAGEVRKPRRAWVLDGDLSVLGLPVVDAQGRAVGVVTTVLSTVASDQSGMGPLSFLGNLDQRKTLGPVGMFLLPASQVARAVAQSKERAAALLRERRESGGAEPAPAVEPAVEEVPAAVEEPETAGETEEEAEPGGEPEPPQGGD
jgi:S1-C subfamily serine protease